MNKIPLFEIMWDKNDITSLNNKIKSGKYWSSGPEIELLENKITKILRIRNCKVFNSGGSALYCLMKAYGFRPGDEIIVPAFTFIATAFAPMYVKAKPVFCDIEKETFGLEPNDILNKITSKTKAVIPIHYGGMPCKIDKIKKICDENNLILIEDAAQSFGASYNNKKVGTFGDSAIFSFCQNKIFTTGEGGCVVTNNQILDNKVELLRSYGRTSGGNYFYNPENIDYIEVGYNFRMASILATLGLSQIEKIDKNIKIRRKNAKLYSKLLEDVNDITIPFRENDGRYNVYQMYPLRINNGKETRNKLISFLERYGISSRIYFEPLYKYSIFNKTHKKNYLKNTEELSSEIITLPMSACITSKQINFIANKIIEFFRRENH